MSFFRFHRRFAAWLAMWVMALSALAPAVAQAMVATSDDAQWMEVCSASGMVWLKIEGATAEELTSGNGMPMGDMSKHCPWCSFHDATAHLPPLVDAPGVSYGFNHVLVAHVDWPHQGRLSALAQARAPPLAS